MAKKKKEEAEIQSLTTTVQNAELEGNVTTTNTPNTNEQNTEEIKKDYSPLDENEFGELKVHLEGIKNYLPEHLMTPFWNWCNRIRAEKTPQPCSCKSSARHWASCVETLRKFVKERE